MPGDLEGLPGVGNPLGLDSAGGVVRTVLDASAAVSDLLLLVAVVSIFVRLRTADGVERQQLKWFAYATGLLVLVVAASLMAFGSSSAFLLAFNVLALLAMPAAIGVAVLRYRLYDVDTVINRTVVYTTLTGVLVVAYLGSVLLFRLVLTPVIGESDVAVAGSTLAVAALFRPARSRVQSLVDKRFYRRRYDADLTLAAFTRRLRHELDLDAVGTALRGAAVETVQPSHASVWVRPLP